MTDIRDTEAVKQALRDKDTVFHLAAMKRVDLSEVECRLAVTINVVGTMNILDAFHGKTFILMSTDKSVEPVNCYGGTKLVAERMVMERAMKAGDGERFMIIRSGNIVGSTGSVIDIWKKQIEQYNEITVTDLEMVRYYTSVEGVVKLYFAMIERGENGKIYYTPTGDERAWKTHDLRNRTIRLVQSGLALMRGGYRDIAAPVASQEVADDLAAGVPKIHPLIIGIPLRLSAPPS